MCAHAYSGVSEKSAHEKLKKQRSPVTHGSGIAIATSLGMIILALITLLSTLFVFTQTLALGRALPSA